MKLSRYIKKCPSPTDRNSVVLFSTKRASAVQVPVAILDDIETGRLSAEEQGSLSDLGLVVQSEGDERHEMLSYIQGLNAADRSVKFIVVLNLDCNLACKYCFEGLRKGRKYLSDEVAARLIEFVKSREYAGKKDIRVTFYGGEPLLSVDRIAGISGEIRLFAQSKGLEYRFSLVTNGVLLTPHVVRRLRPLGLSSVKVTLDGPMDIHDVYRPFKNGGGSFEVILRNIRDILGLVSVQVGGNYTRSNYLQFPRLLDFLSAEGLGQDRIAAVKFDPVVNESSEFALPDFREGCASMDEPWVAEASVWLREETLRRGYRTPRIMPSPCLMERDDSYVMDHDGVLYKCPGLIGRQACAIGDVWKGVEDYRSSHGLDEWKNDTCLECAYLPLCFGGCKYLKLIRDNTMRGVQCQRAYFDRVMDSLVAQDILYDQ